MLAAALLSTMVVASAAFVGFDASAREASVEPSAQAADAADPMELDLATLEAARVEPQREAVPRSEGLDGPSAVGADVRATIVLRGELGDAHQLGRELDIRVQPWWRSHGELAAHSAGVGVQWGEFDDGANSAFERIDVRNVDVRNVEQVREVLIADGEPGLGVSAHPDGSFERDVTSLFLGARGVPDGLVLTVQHKNFLPMSRWIESVSNAAPLDAARLEREVRYEITFYERLQPVCLLSGLAVCFDSDCKARVEVWALDGDKPGGLRGEASTSSAAREYEIAVEPGHRYAVVACADGYLPRTVIVHTLDALNLHVEPLVLDHGARFSGRIDLARHTFGGEVWLYLSREKPVLSREPRYGRDALIWTGREFAPSVDGVRSHDGGAFEFAGFALGRYELRVGIDREWWTEMDPVFYVDVPARDVVLPAPLARVELQIEQGDEPLASRAIRLEGLGRSSASRAHLRTDRDGRAEAWLLQGEPYMVFVPMPSGPEWSYGKVVPWNTSALTEHIRMSAWRGRK